MSLPSPKYIGRQKTWSSHGNCDVSINVFARVVGADSCNLTMRIQCSSGKMGLWMYLRNPSSMLWLTAVLTTQSESIVTIVRVRIAQLNLMFIGPCIIVIVEEWKTNLMPLAILFHFLCVQHVSDINISIIRSLRLFCWITTSVVLFCKDGWFSVSVNYGI